MEGPNSFSVLRYRLRGELLGSNLIIFMLINECFSIILWSSFPFLSAFSQDWSNFCSYRFLCHCSIGAVPGPGHGCGVFTEAF